MLRLSNELLSFQDDIAYYKNKLFSGGCFYRDEKSSTINIDVYKDGVNSGEYIFSHFPEVSGNVFVDREVLYNPLSEEGDYEVIEPFSYDGKLFSGVAFDFFKNQMCTESLYTEGYLVAEASFDSVGNLMAVNNESLRPGAWAKPYYDICWKTIRQFESFSVVGEDQDSACINMRFDEGDRLKYLELSNFFKKISILYNQLDYIGCEVKKDYFPQVAEDFVKYDLSNSMILSGKDITSSFFNTLITEKNSSQLICLGLSKTKVSFEHLTLFFAKSQLKALYLKDNEGLQLADAKLLKKQKPECNVFFNEEPISC